MAKIKTEQAWLRSTTPHSLLSALKGKRQPRQRRLFAVACCRRVLSEMADSESRTAVDVAERFADGLASREERDEAFRAAQNVALRHIQRCQGLTRLEQEAAWSVWWLAYAAQLACAPSGMDGASAELLKNAARRDGKRKEQEKQVHSDLIRDIFGNPFRTLPPVEPGWLAWKDRTVPQLAQAIFDARRFQDLPVLADALEEAGCTATDLLAHCREPGEHVRGCWVIDLILRKG
jgi:hypothetical protein